MALSRHISSGLYKGKRKYNNIQHLIGDHKEEKMTPRTRPYWDSLLKLKRNPWSDKTFEAIPEQINSLLNQFV